MISPTFKQRPQDKTVHPPFDSNGLALDIVEIEELVGSAVIGICADELYIPQPITISLYMGIPRPVACKTDQIQHTIDYDCVRTTILNLMSNNKFKLLEAFAENLASKLLKEYPIFWLKLSVKKPHKYKDVKAVGICIERKSSQIFEHTRESSKIYNLIGTGLIPKNAKSQLSR